MQKGTELSLFVWKIVDQVLGEKRKGGAKNQGPPKKTPSGGVRSKRGIPFTKAGLKEKRHGGTTNGENWGIGGKSGNKGGRKP